MRGSTPQGRHPFLLDRPCVVKRERGGLGKLIFPPEWPARVDDHLRVRGLSALARLRGDARVERRTPGMPHDVDRFRGLAARRYRPHDVGEIGWIDVIDRKSTRLNSSHVSESRM